MKALSLWQPWASLIACGAKAHETRHWPAPRGLIGQRIAIHAAKRMVHDPGEDLEALLVDEFGGHWVVDLPRGAVVATAILAGCYPTEHRRPYATHEDELCGDWYPGRYAWHLWDVRKIAPSIPCRGAQGLWDWNEHLAGLGTKVGTGID